MKKQVFISIGTKGTSLPLALTELTPPLKVGVNVLRWAGRGKVPEAAKANGWVSKNGGPFELYPLNQAIREGRVRRLPRVAWVRQADCQRHVGEAFFPNWWQPGDPQPLLIAVRSDTWTYGCVDSKIIRDGRNRDTVAHFEAGGLSVSGDSLSSKRGLATTAEEWTDDELRATVTVYLQMLEHEQAGQPYRKAGYNKRLRAEALSSRSKASVEYRMQNISAVLAEIGHPWITGYKPQSHVGEAVKARLRRLLRNAAPAKFTPYDPSADHQKVAQRTRTLLGGSLRRPVGDAAPKSVERATKQFIRNPAVQAFVRQEAAGTCELCRKPAPFVDEVGIPFLEVHHVVPLAEKGPDTPENAVALCPNCHRHLHHGRDQVKARSRLYLQGSRLQPPT